MGTVSVRLPVFPSWATEKWGFLVVIVSSGVSYTFVLLPTLRRPVHCYRELFLLTAGPYVSPIVVLRLAKRFRFYIWNGNHVVVLFVLLCSFSFRYVIMTPPPVRATIMTFWFLTIFGFPTTSTLPRMFWYIKQVTKNQLLNYSTIQQNQVLKYPTTQVFNYSTRGNVVWTFE